MRIAIDARWILRDMSGIGVYTRELVRHLVQSDSEDEFILLFNDPVVRDCTVAETGVAAARNVETVLVPYGVFSLRSQWRLPRLLRDRQVDVYHSTNYMIPFAAFPRSRSGRTRCVVTIHDVIPLALPDHAPRSKKARLMPLYRRLMREVARRAHVIITDSRYSRDDVLRHLCVPSAEAQRVKVVYVGVSDRFTPPAARPPRGPQDMRTVLYVGRSDPYKNVPLLVEAFARARRACPFPVELCLAGSPDPRYPEALQTAARLGVAEFVRWTGSLPEAELVALYRRADVLVHLSRYEGFGLQVAEAMACGVPVICSNVASLPEVAGDAAILLPPDDVAGCASAIAKVLTQFDVAEDMRRKGPPRATRFRWAETARQTVAIYREALAAR
jgi:glycosyltransferase involved in cell wall biosynthesis